MPQFNAVIEQVDSMLADHLLHLGVIRKEHLYADAVSAVGAVNQVIYLGEHTTGIEGEYSGALLAVTGYHIGHGLVLITEAGGECGA